MTKTTDGLQSLNYLPSGPLQKASQLHTKPTSHIRTSVTGGTPLLSARMRLAASDSIHNSSGLNKVPIYCPSPKSHKRQYNAGIVFLGIMNRGSVFLLLDLHLKD